MKLLKKKIFINLLSSGFLLSSFFVMLTGTIVSCSKSNKEDYSFVTTDASLTGNLVTLGFKPTLQELYNEQTNVPSYIRNLDIKIEYGKVPKPNNAELWLKRSPQVLYGYTYDKPTELSNYGFKSFIENLNSYDNDIIQALSGRVDSSAEKYAKTWNLLTSMQDLGTKLDKVIRTKNNTSIFENDSISHIVENVKFNLIKKLKVIKENAGFSTSDPISISFWGKSYGPNWVQNEINWSEYGPSIDYPGWLFSNLPESLSFQPAVPTEKNFKLKVFENGGFNAQGWITDAGVYNAEAVQKAFSKSSDIVVVALSTKLYNDKAMLDNARNNFFGMLKDQNKGKVIFVDSGEFSITPYNLLGCEYAINTLASGLLNSDFANIVINTPLFDLHNLHVLSSKNFNFVANENNKQK